MTMKKVEPSEAEKELFGDVQDLSTTKEEAKEEKADPITDDFLDHSEMRQDEPLGESLFSGAEYWDFERNPIFYGCYLCEHEFAEGVESKGYDFQDEKGDEHIIGNNFAIVQALETTIKGKRVKDMQRPWLWIKFLGKIKVKNGNFSKFKIKLVAPPKKSS